MSNSAELLAMLQQELSCAQSLLKTLESEKLLLESRDLVQLQPILERKAELLTELEQLSQTRQRWQQTQGFPQTSEALLTQLQSLQNFHGAAAIDCLHQHTEIVKKCNYYNELNGILISNSKKRNSRQLDLMRGISQEQKLYTANGATESNSSQHNVGEA